MSVIYKNNYCELIFESSTDFIEVKWTGFPKSEPFREACLHLLEFMKTLQIKKLLTNNLDVKLFSVSDQRWINEEWLPKAEQLGYYCSATVNSNDVVVKTAITNITTRRDSKFKTKQFSQLSEAKNWLMQV